MNTKVLFVLLPLLSKHDHLQFLFFPQTMIRRSSFLACNYFDVKRVLFHMLTEGSLLLRAKRGSTFN